MRFGGLLKSASLTALLAAAGLFGGGVSAKAADLGGDCCADLEERVAELEATTVRKGNRKVSVTLSGYVSHHVMFWDDGTQSDMYIGDGGNYGSRWRFVGSAKISPTVTAGFLYEFQGTNNSISSANQLNGGDDLGGSLAIRDTTVWLRHSQLGMIKVGHGSTSTDNLVLIDLGGLAGAATPDVSLYGGGMILRGPGGMAQGGAATTAGLTWTSAIRGHESWDTSRRNHVLYETPSMAGFTLQAAVAEDNYWDVALRYAGEFGGIRIAGGIGYSRDTEFNGGSQAFNAAGALCSTHCNVESTEIKGSLSVLHVPTGLFVTGAAGRRELEGQINDGPLAGASYTGPDAQFWWVAGGISKNFSGLGRTVFYGEYGEHRGGLAQTAFLTHVSAATNPNHDIVSNSTVTSWGLGIVQHIDAAAMEIYAAYKVFELDATGFSGVNAHLNNGGAADLQMFIVGTRISF